MEQFKTNFRCTFICDRPCSFPICQLNEEDAKSQKESRITRWQKRGSQNDCVGHHLSLIPAVVPGWGCGSGRASKVFATASSQFSPHVLVKLFPHQSHGGVLRFNKQKVMEKLKQQHMHWPLPNGQCNNFPRGKLNMRDLTE